METINLLGLNDQAMTDRVKAEAPAGSTLTMAVYERFSAFGFARLRKSARYSALSDFEKSELAYDAAGLFLRAILSGQYQPMEGVASAAYYWTICGRRAIDALRKLAVHKPGGQNPETEASADELPATGSFARRESLDADPLLLDARQQENITAWVDAQLIWDIIRKDLGQHCYDILVETVQKDRPQEAVSLDMGYAPGSLKALKTKCLSQLRNLLRKEL